MKTILDVISTRAYSSGNNIIFSFLNDGEIEQCSLTYSSLHRQANLISSYVSRLTKPGDRVLLLYPTGPEFICAFIGCLYAGLIAVPVPIPRARHRDERLQSVINNCSPTMTMTYTAVMEKGLQAQGLGKLICTDSITVGTDPGIYVAKEDDIAFLQYTSGSTAEPRGVIVSHSNITHNAACLKEASGYHQGTIGVTWLPHFHDMGLVEGLLQPIIHGFRCYVLSPGQFMQRPWRWLAAIGRYKATHSGGPNFAYDLCVKSISLMEAASLDLSSWELAYNGAEPIRSSTIDAFASRFSSTGFRREAFHPAYGLAEATLVVSTAYKGKGPRFIRVDTALLRHGKVADADPGPNSLTLVSSGRPILDTRLVIVNPKNNTILDGEVGEIWIANKSISKGYWGREEETIINFHSYIQNEEGYQGPYFRTGDLGFMRNGEVFITGRLKELIIVNGRNHYPQDIEHTVKGSMGYVGYMEVAAFSLIRPDFEGIGVLVELTRQSLKTFENSEDLLPAKSILNNIKAEIASKHDLEINFFGLMRPGTIPKTTSGKVRRAECSKQYNLQILDSVWEWRLTK